MKLLFLKLTLAFLAHGGFGCLMYRVNHLTDLAMFRSDTVRFGAPMLFGLIAFPLAFKFKARGIIPSLGLLFVSTSAYMFVALNVFGS